MLISRHGHNPDHMLISWHGHTHTILVTHRYHGMVTLTQPWSHANVMAWSHSHNPGHALISWHGHTHTTLATH